MRLSAMLSSISILTLGLIACSERPQPSADTENIRSHALALGAQQPNTVLILDTSVGLGIQSYEAAHAAALGFNVELASPADWAAKSTADFATYRAIILGDTGCNLNAVAAAQANTSVWGPAVTGNVLIAGNMPNSHISNGSDLFISSAVQFATSQPNATGAYISLSCYYYWNAGPMTPVPLLDGLGSFSVNAPDICYNDVHQVGTHPAMTLLMDNRISNWNCSANALFDSYPPGFDPFAIVENAVEPGQLAFPDGSVGIPYILTRGASLSLCGNGILDPGEACDDGNYITGDLCSEKCLPNVIACGDWDIDIGEQCDDGNQISGDGCSDSCQWEIVPAIGACCLSGGGCMEAMSPSDCTLIGEFTADGLTCSDVAPECGGLLGACCMPQGGCQDSMAQGSCQQTGGVFLGTGTNCNDQGLACVPPPETGACCMPLGGCLDNMTASICNEKGGVYLNDGSTCATDGLLCPPPQETGACCVSQGCAEMSALDCEAVGGAYAGNGTICSEATCPGCTDQPIGACCIDGACFMLSASACYLNGGMYGGDGSLCTSGTCDCGGPNGCCEEIAAGCSVSAKHDPKGSVWFAVAAAALSAGLVSRRKRNR